MNSRKSSCKQMVDQGASVGYAQYWYHAAEINGEKVYWAQHENGYDAVGPFRHFAQLDRAVIKEVTSKRLALRSMISGKSRTEK